MIFKRIFLCFIEILCKFDENHNIIEVVSYANDVTERKKMERKLETYVKKLKEDISEKFIEEIDFREFEKNF